MITLSLFPKDCWSKKCKHFVVYDMSIDDLCCHCKLLNVSCDACDEYFSNIECPLKESKWHKFWSNFNVRLGGFSFGIRKCKTKDFKWFYCPLGKYYRKEGFIFFWWFGHKWYMALHRKVKQNKVYGDVQIL